MSHVAATGDSPRESLGAGATNAGIFCRSVI